MAEDLPFWLRNHSKPRFGQTVMIRVKMHNGITAHSFTFAAFNGVAWRAFNGGPICDGIVTQWMEIR